jgi:hypothetical protein
MALDLNKPAYGDDCNGCGQCCMGYPCPLGAALFKQKLGRCPALEEGAGRYECGLVKNPERYAPFRAVAVGKERLREAALILIGSGVGCDAQLEDEPDNAAYKATLQMEYQRIRFSRRFARAMQAWGYLPPELGL